MSVSVTDLMMEVVMVMVMVMVMEMEMEVTMESLATQNQSCRETEKRI